MPRQNNFHRGTYFLFYGFTDLHIASVLSTNLKQGLSNLS